MNSGIDSDDYSSEAAFDALTYSPTGDLERLNVKGGGVATTQITFGQQVNSVLLLIGDADNTTSSVGNLNASQWDFADSLNLTVVDTTSPPLIITPGNIALNSFR